MTGVPARSSASRTESSDPGLSVNDDVVQPLGRRLDEADLLLVTAGALGDQRPVLLPGLQAEVLQEPLGHLEIRHFQRVVMQP